jgi:hypothetical protein
MTAILTSPDTTLDTPFTLGGREFRSRLMVGTGKYRDNATMAAAIEASGAEIVTVAVRRVDLDRRKEESILHHLPADRYFLLANTAGCYTADEVHQLDRVAGGEGGGAQAGTADDLAVELHDHGARVEAQRRQQIEQGRRLGDAARLSVHHDLHVAHPSSIHGASRASAAAAGSGACHSARMAATP